MERAGIHAADAMLFLEWAAQYFERRPTGGEDRAHWSNAHNAENCRRIAKLIEGMAVDCSRPWERLPHAS